MTKRLVLASIIISICILICACGKASDYQQSIYNNDSLINKEGDSYFASSLKVKGSNGDYQVAFTNFTGSKTIWDTESDEEKEINIDFSSKMAKGESKLVLINPDGTIFELNNGVEKENHNYKLPKGKNRIKVVGKNSSGEFTIKIDK